jgi:SNF family Na+-dependent transporter
MPKQEQEEKSCFLVACRVCKSILYSTWQEYIILDIIDNFVNSYGLVTEGLLEAINLGCFFGAF